MVQYPEVNLPHFGPESWTVRISVLEPSTLRLNITDGPYLRSGPSMLMLHIADGSGTLLRFLFRITATTDRQAGLTQSPAQPCRIVAAGDALEATEKGPHNLRI